MGKRLKPQNDPLVLLQMRKKFELQKKRKKNEEYLKHKHKKDFRPIKNTRRKPLKYFSEDDKTLFAVSKENIFPDKTFNISIKQYKQGEPKFAVQVLKKGFRNTEFYTAVLKRLPYDIFIQIRDWMIEYSDVFEELYKEYSKEKIKQLNNDLKKEFLLTEYKFPEIDEVQKLLNK